MVAGCGGSEDSNDGLRRRRLGGREEQLSLVAYSTPEVVYDEIIPAFRKTDAGKDVGFKTSFGASGEQSRAVEGGLKADVVSFSIEPDTERLVEAGLVDKDWTSATSTTASCPSRSCPSSSARATRRTSRPGTTW